MNRVILAISIVVLCIFIARFKRPKHPLPPGPAPWPLVGNVLDMPTLRPWEKYREWCETYNSDLIFLHLPKQPSVIVGTAKAAMELLEKRSQLYSDRVRSVMFELIGCESHFSLMPYTSRWRIHRRMFHQHFYPAYVPKYQPVQLQHARAFLSWILESPQHIRKHVRHMVTSVIFEITYGKKISGMDDDHVTYAQLGVQGISQASIPGIYWVEYLPFLKYIPSWVPGTKSRKLADHYLPYVLGMRDRPYQEVKQAVDNGSASPSLAASLIEEVRTKYSNSEDEQTYDEVARNVAGIAYAAGADTTSSAAQYFLLAMAMFPRVQAAAQKELDRVVGPHRLPDYEDMDNLPYVRAIVLETLRWLPVTPFSIPHAAIADDVYEGHLIPKGTRLIPNVWAMLRNPEDYPDPDEFKPERYFDKNGNIDPNVRDPTTIAFGFGRRLCPGRHMAMNTLSIYVASTLHCFNISAGVDSVGRPIELSTEMVGAMITVPQDIPCGLEPRFEAVAHLIREAAAEVELA